MNIDDWLIDGMLFNISFKRIGRHWRWKVYSRQIYCDKVSQFSPLSSKGRSKLVALYVKQGYHW